MTEAKGNIERMKQWKPIAVPTPRRTPPTATPEAHSMESSISEPHPKSARAFRMG